MNLRDGELLAIKNKAVPQWLDKVIDEKRIMIRSMILNEPHRIN